MEKTIRQYARQKAIFCVYQNLLIDASLEDLLHFIWDERRRELCFEEAMRFWDLRRQGRPQIVHKWYNSWNTYEVYTLPATSANYVLRIPESELKYNTECMDNTRENITANK